MFASPFWNGMKLNSSIDVACFNIENKQTLITSFYDVIKVLN